MELPLWEEIETLHPLQDEKHGLATCGRSLMIALLRQPLLELTAIRNITNQAYQLNPSCHFSEAWWCSGGGTTEGVLVVLAWRR